MSESRQKAAGRGQRYREVDIARGIAVVMMVVFHFTWDLNHFGLTATDMLHGSWYWFGRVTGSMFVFMLGLSMQLAVQRKLSPFRFYARRASGLFALGGLVSFATWLSVPRGYVIFGILSLLGLLCLLLYPLRKLPVWALVLAGIAMIAAGFPLNRIHWESPWLLWLGVMQQGRYMPDWYPLLPWGGFGVLGIAAGKWLYAKRETGFLPYKRDASFAERGVKFLGRHPLAIYLVHQPVLMAAFWLLGFRA